MKTMLCPFSDSKNHFTIKRWMTFSTPTAVQGNSFFQAGCYWMREAYNIYRITGYVFFVVVVVVVVMIFFRYKNQGYLLDS